MVAQITLQEALGVSAVSLLFGLMVMRWQPALRRSVLVKFLMIVIGLGGLALLSRYQLIPANLAISFIPREICLLIVALGNIQLWIAFLGNVLLHKRTVPRILGEVIMAVALVIYAGGERSAAFQRRDHCGGELEAQEVHGRCFLRGLAL